MISNITQTLPNFFANSNDDHQIATGRQAGGAAVATGVLALATIAMITEFIVYSGFTPKVKYGYDIKMRIAIVFNNMVVSIIDTNLIMQI